MPRLSFHATPALAREIKKRVHPPDTNMSDVIRGLIEAGLGQSPDEIAATQVAMRARGTQQLIVNKLYKALHKAIHEASDAVLSEFVTLDEPDEEG
jgi:hypothetical protein